MKYIMDTFKEATQSSHSPWLLSINTVSKLLDADRTECNAKLFPVQYFFLFANRRAAVGVDKFTQNIVENIQILIWCLYIQLKSNSHTQAYT